MEFSPFLRLDQVLRLRIACCSPFLVFLFLIGWSCEAIAFNDGAELLPERRVTQMQPVPAWKETWDAARQHVAAQQNEQAIDLYESILLLKPNLIEARREYAWLLFSVGRYEAAVTVFEALVETNPDRLDVSRGLGQALAALGKDSRAVEIFQKILPFSPEDPQLLRLIATGLQRLGRPAEALSQMVAYCRIVSSDDLMRRELIDTALSLGQFELARSYLVVLADREDAEADLLEKAARLHQQLSLDNPAAVYWRRALAKKPKVVDGHRFLAAYLQKNGRGREALPHFLSLIDLGQSDPELWLAVAGIYRDKGDEARALPYLEQYSRKRPEDKQAAQALIAAHAAAGDRGKTLAALERFFSIEKAPEPERIRQAAELYKASGRLRDALPLYRKLLELSPTDPELLEILAKDLVALGETEGSLDMWRKLAKVAPDRLDVYLAMAHLLEQLGKNQELRVVLETISRLDPTNTRVHLRVALAFLDTGEFARAMECMPRFEGVSLADGDLLLLRARFFEELGYAAKAFADYQRLVELGMGQQEEVLLGVLRTAGHLGFLPRVLEILDLLEQQGKGGADWLSVAARSLWQAGDLERAMRLYRQIITSQEEVSAGQDLLFSAKRREAFKHLVYLLQKTGRPYDAEEILRQTLAQQGPQTWVLLLLGQLALDQNRPSDAAIWIEAGREGVQEAGQEAEIRFRLFDMRRALVADERRTALRQARAIADLFGQIPGGVSSAADWTETQSLLLDFARLLRQAGKYEDAARYAGQVVSAAVRPLDVLEARVLLISVYNQSGDLQAARQERALAQIVADTDVGLAVAFARMSLQEGDVETALMSAERVREHLPQSSAVSLLLIESYLARGRSLDALADLADIEGDSHEFVHLNVHHIQILSENGRFSEALTLLDRLSTERAGERDMVFLKARMLWALGRWQEAEATYEGMLRPDVQEQFKLRLRAKGLPFPEERKDNGVHSLAFWRTDRNGGDLDHIFDPATFVRAEDQDGKVRQQIAAGFFTAHAWQKRVRDELNARVAVRQQEYYRAARLYRALIQQYGASPMISFDLAGIYSRLDRVGEEASLYAAIRETAPDYPGIVDAQARNRLKLRPSIAVSHDRHEEEGYDGKKAIQEMRTGLMATFFPRPRQEITASVDRILFQSSDEGSGRLWANRVFFEWRTPLFLGVSGIVGGGVLQRNSGKGDSSLFRAEISGDIGDRLEGRLSYSRDVTADTLESVASRIEQEDFVGELAVDLMPRLRVAGKYVALNFSDGIITEGYGLSGVWTLVTAPTLLEASYSYDFLDSRQGSSPALLLGGGGPGEMHPYWTPQNFWLNKFSLYFKHRLSSETFGREIPRYYTALYSLGHDSGGHAQQTLQGGMFVELNPNLMIRAMADVTSSPAYRRRGINVSLVYRW